MNTLIKQFNAKWETVRGVAKWARRNIGYNYGTLDNGEDYCISGHYDIYNKKYYVALIVYGSGYIKLTSDDISKLKKYFNQACKH